MSISIGHPTALSFALVQAYRIFLLVLPTSYLSNYTTARGSVASLGSQQLTTLIGARAGVASVGSQQRWANTAALITIFQLFVAYFPGQLVVNAVP